MPTSIQILFWLVLIALFTGFIAFIINQFESNEAERQSFRRVALEQFESWQSSNAATQIQIGPGHCEVVQESETVGRVRNGKIYGSVAVRRPSSAN